MVIALTTSAYQFLRLGAGDAEAPITAIENREGYVVVSQD